MQNVESYDILVLGSGEAGKYLAWTMAKARSETRNQHGEVVQILTAKLVVPRRHHE